MSSYFKIPSLLLLCFSVLLHVATGAGPLFHFCSSSGDYNANSPYASNLNRLETYLYRQTPFGGFAMRSVGSTPYEANGLGLCRGDVKFQDCQTCISEARDELSKLCPHNKGGIIWYDYCELKYTDLDFFGQIDNQNKFYMWNLNNISDPVSFNKKTRELLSQLTQLAYVSPRLYATGETEFEGSTKLYGLVQCTRDLSNDDCKKCLDEAISELPNCCDGKQGGRVVGGSCNFRYEIYPFVNS